VDRKVTVDIDLNLYEARVIGSLIEKEITTPDQYPLSLNALTNACNQKSNREPVLELDEATVQQTADGLIKKHFVNEKTGFGSRVIKYRHRFCNTEFGNLRFSEQELGIICVLLLRGPQTPGELRSRTSRLCKFNDVDEVEATLESLMARDDGPFVARLPREPGRRESRYVHLFSADLPESVPAEPVGESAGPAGSEHERLDRLEQLVSEMKREIERLKRQLEALTPAATSGGTEG
jgi:uncharacterized protein YceH (UPF0502 family)